MINLLNLKISNNLTDYLPPLQVNNDIFFIKMMKKVEAMLALCSVLSSDGLMSDTACGRCYEYDI